MGMQTYFCESIIEESVQTTISEYSLTK